MALWGMCSCSLCRDTCGDIAVRGKTSLLGQDSLPVGPDRRRGHARMVECRVPMDRGNAMIKDGSLDQTVLYHGGTQARGGGFHEHGRRGARGYSSTWRGLRYG